MSAKFEKSFEDYHALAIDSWSHGKRLEGFIASVDLNGKPIIGKSGWMETIPVYEPSSYSKAFSKIEEEAQVIENSALKDLAIGGLCFFVTNQAARNDKRTWIERQDSEFRKQNDNLIKADAYPDELVSFLYDNPELGSIEIARKTHVMQWAVRDVIDRPVRRRLDNTENELNTKKTYERAIYKAKQFDKAGIAVERKRTIYTHFGGSVLTKIRNNLVIDALDETLPQEIRDKIESDRDLVSKGKYDFNQHCEYLYETIEEHMRNREVAEKPTYVKPLQTTYYSTIATPSN
jgi:hypothetical protein